LKLAADGILPVRDRQVEVERNAGEREIGKVLGGEEMAELVVGVEQHQDREIGLIAEDATDGEARSRRVVERRGTPAAVEAAQVHGPVRLQLVDRFGGHGVLRKRDGEVRSGERRADGSDINDDRRLRADCRRTCSGPDRGTCRDRHRK
jgi:hypothetical protein